MPGEKAYIVDVNNHKLCEKFFEMGVFPGDLVEVQINASGNNQITVRINSRTFRIFKKAAEHVMTGAVDKQVCLN
jgi:Fe2+ transport system protein FeoA